jgi:hypothetical protein
MDLDQIEQRAMAWGWKTLRTDWNERGDRAYLKVWRYNTTPVTFTLTPKGVRSWPESVDNSDLLRN